MITHFRLWLLAIILATLSIHLYKIAELPMGLYLDETSIGLNAATIAESGRDEHGESWPIYFKAFGEYKNPIYVYTTSALFRIFGVSEWALRLTSALFYLVAFAIAGLLFRQLFPGRPGVQLWALAAFGALPQYLTMSRISFEVISQIPFTCGILLLAFHFFKADNTRRHSILLAAGIGALLGISIYSYSTARLLNPLLVMALIACCVKWQRDHTGIGVRLDYSQLLPVSVLILTTALCLIPYLHFAQSTPDGLTGRFLGLTYLDDDIPLFDKLAIFIKNYLGYWAPQFLLYRGDHNLRHAIGYSGMIFIVVYALALFTLGYWWKFKSFLHDTFIRFFLLSWLIAPIAASTIDEQHALRSATVGLHWVIASGYGLHYLAGIFGLTTFPTIFKAASAALALEICLYVGAYWVVFPERSLHGSEAYDVAGAYELALSRGPSKIWFVADPHDAYTNIKFRMAAAPQNEIPMEIRHGYNFSPRSNECVIYPIWGENRLRAAQFSYAPALEPNWLQRLFKVPRKDHITRLKCYE